MTHYTSEPVRAAWERELFVIFHSTQDRVTAKRIGLKLIAVPHVPENVPIPSP